MRSRQEKRRKVQRDRYNENKENIMHERHSVANKAKARERYQANSEQKRADVRQRSTQTLNRSDTLKEHGIKKTKNPSGFVSANATLFMLKQEAQYYYPAWSDLNTASEVLDNKKSKIKL